MLGGKGGRCSPSFLTSGFPPVASGGQQLGIPAGMRVRGMQGVTEGRHRGWGPEAGVPLVAVAAGAGGEGPRSLSGACTASLHPTLHQQRVPAAPGVLQMCPGEQQQVPAPETAGASRSHPCTDTPALGRFQPFRYLCLQIPALGPFLLQGFGGVSAFLSRDSSSGEVSYGE